MGSALEDFEVLLEKTKNLFMEENSILKQGGTIDSLLERKKELLSELDSALMALKNATEDAPSQKSLMRVLQDRIMKLLLIDRENEQLLLKQSVGAFAAGKSAQKPTDGKLEKLYKSVQ